MRGICVAPLCAARAAAWSISTPSKRTWTEWFPCTRASCRRREPRSRPARSWSLAQAIAADLAQCGAIDGLDEHQLARGLEAGKTTSSEVAQRSEFRWIAG